MIATILLVGSVEIDATEFTNPAVVSSRTPLADIWTPRRVEEAAVNRRFTLRTAQ